MLLINQYKTPTIIKQSKQPKQSKQLKMSTPSFKYIWGKNDTYVDKYKGKDTKKIYGAKIMEAKEQSEWINDYRFACKNIEGSKSQKEQLEYAFPITESDWRGSDKNPVEMISARMIYNRNPNPLMEELIYFDGTENKFKNYLTQINPMFLNPMSDVDQEYITEQIEGATGMIMQKEEKRITKILDMIDFAMEEGMNSHESLCDMLGNTPGFKRMKLTHTMDIPYFWYHIIGKNGWRLKKTSEVHGVEFIYYYNYKKNNKYVNEIVFLGTNPENVQSAVNFIGDRILTKQVDFDQEIFEDYLREEQERRWMEDEMDIRDQKKLFDRHYMERLAH